MTIHDTSLAGKATQHPVVLRFADMTPVQIAFFEAHRLRRGESGMHVDPSQRNRLLIGGEDWGSETLQLIERMRRQNHLIEAEALRKRGRARALDAVLERGPKDPWDARASGPMREVILTAHKDWFDLGETAASRLGLVRNSRELAFEETAVKWLTDNFGEDVVHARADHDETTYHIHAVIMPAKKMLKRKKGESEPQLPVPGEDLFTHNGKPCKVQLVASKHPLLRNYELAQDSVGFAFAAIGLTRGTRHWTATRQALKEGKEPGPRPTHKPAHVWRAEQETALKKKAEKQAQKEAVLRQREAAAAARASELAAAERRMAAELAETQRKSAKADRLKNNAYAVLAIATAVATGQIYTEAGNLDIALQRASLAPNLKQKIEASPDKAASTLKLFGKAYGVMRSRARAEFAAGLAIIERTARALDYLQQRLDALAANGTLSPGIFGKLFGRERQEERKTLDAAKQEAKRLRNKVCDDER